MLESRLIRSHSHESGNPVWPHPDSDFRDDILLNKQPVMDSRLRGNDNTKTNYQKRVFHILGYIEN